MQVARKIAYNVLVSSVSKIISTALALVSIALITRYLGQGGFGDYATVLAFLAFFSAIADLGLNSVSTREISRPGASESQIIGNIFALRVVVSLFVFFLSPVIVLFFPYPPEVKAAIVVVAASFVFSSSYQVLNGVFQKNLAMDKVAISELSGRLVQVGIIFWAIKYDRGFLWIISSLLFYMIVAFSLVFFWSKKYISFKPRFDFSYWKKFLLEAYPLGIGAVITFVYFKIDTIMLSVMRTSAEVGIYNAAYKVIENITFFPSMIVGLIFPIQSARIFADKAGFRDISDKTYKVFWIFVVPLVVGTLFLSDGVISLIGGGGFGESAAVLRVLIFALAFIFFSNFSNAILIAGNEQKRLMKILGAAAFLNVALNLVFIPLYSYEAAAFISLLTEFFVAAATFLAMKKRLGYFPSSRDLLGIMASGAVMAVSLFLMRGWNFFLSGFLAVAVYLCMLWIAGALKVDDFTSIIGRKKRSSATFPPDIVPR